MSDLKTLSLNCRGLQGIKKRLQVFQHIKETKCDIYCLQDTHFLKKQFNTIYTQWNAECFLSCSTSNSRGVAILFSKSIEYKIYKNIVDDNGNYVILDLSVGEIRFTLVSLYGPNSDNPSFYETIFKIIENIGNDCFCICGDFNLVQDPSLDYFNYKNINNKLAFETHGRKMFNRPI